MENKIDQFFKDKLEGNALLPSEEAWAKVESNLSKKNNVAVWRIAAAILITGALVSVIIWSQREDKNKEQILATKKSSLPGSVSPQTQNNQQESSKNKKWPVKTPTTVEESRNKESLNASPKSENKLDQKKAEEIEMTQATVAETKEQPVAVLKESIQDEKINTKATLPATIASTRQKPIKLEFTLDDFSSEQPVATASEEKSSGLKKVWDLAREVKNGDRPVHEIKNELFALSFKKNKNQ